jgi:hypothetical protein
MLPYVEPVDTDIKWAIHFFQQKINGMHIFSQTCSHSIYSWIEIIACRHSLHMNNGLKAQIQNWHNSARPRWRRPRPHPNCRPRLASPMNGGSYRLVVPPASHPCLSTSPSHNHLHRDGPANTTPAKFFSWRPVSSGKVLETIRTVRDKPSGKKWQG